MTFKTILLFISVATPLFAMDPFDQPQETIKKLKDIEHKYHQAKRLKREEKQTLEAVLDSFEQPQTQPQPKKQSIYYRNFYNLYIAALEEQENLTPEDRHALFMSQMENGHPFSSPIKVGSNEFRFIDDTILPSPARQSKRKRNLRRALLENKNFIEVSPTKGETIVTELHHLTQSDTNETIIDMPDFYHRPYHGLLHNDDIESRINRSKFTTDKKRARRIYSVRKLINFVEESTQGQTSTDHQPN